MSATPPVMPTIRVPRGSPRTLCLAGLGCAVSVWATAAYGQTTSTPRLTVTSGISVSEIVTDNVALASNNRQWEAITRASPYIRVTSNAGPVRGSLDYTLSATAYARDSSRNAVQHAISAGSGFQAELIDNHAFIDVRASISRQSISAFGVQSPSDLALNANSTEVRSISVSPFVRGNIAGLVDVEARLNETRSSSTSGSTADSVNRSASARASGGRGLVGWSVDHSRSISSYDRGRETTADRTGLSLSFRPDPDFRISARAGRESNDVLSLQSQTSTSWGGGVDWTPSPRTSASFQMDRRYFGNSHSVSLQHRTARTVWTFSDSRSASSDRGTGFTAGVIREYDRLFLELAPIEPDPARRDLLVRALLATQGGFLTSAESLQRRQQLGMVWSGLRASFSATAYRTTTSRLDRLSPGRDDLSQVDALQQHGYSLTSSYRLTPTTGLGLSYSRATTPDAGTQGGNDQQTINFSLTNQIARRASFTLSLRHVSFDSPGRSYTENAATATLNLQFF